MTEQLVVFGPGYSAMPIIMQAQQNGWAVYGSYRKEESRTALVDADITPFSFSDGGIGKLNTDLPTHILISIAPREEHDPTLAIWKSCLNQLKNIQSIHYLSSTNVYGDRDGGWVDETTEPAPSLARGKKRLIAEREWQAFAKEASARCFVYRLAGIYGPGRNAFTSIKNGKARCIIKQGQVFGRIHQADICQTVWTAMTGKHAGGIFNLADDKPCPPHEVIEAAANMLGQPAPPHENWETAEMSEMARSFYLESKRVKNDKVKSELAITLKYPSYKEGLADLFKTNG